MDDNSWQTINLYVQIEDSIFVIFYICWKLFVSVTQFVGPVKQKFSPSRWGGWIEL